MKIESQIIGKAQTSMFMKLPRKFKRYPMLLAFAFAVSICVFMVESTSIANDHPFHPDSKPVDFKTEIIPVLTKMGCNAGACHGAAAGRGGLKLSLYGSQPDDDFRVIVQDDKGRRINLADYRKSLILRKPGGELDHGGEQRFELSDPAGQLLAKWIKEGAKRSESVRLESFDVGPKSIRFDSIDHKHPFKFTATFSDGSTKDVTRWTVVTSNDESSLAIDGNTNTASIKRPGRHIVIARFLDRVVPIEFLIPFYEQQEESKPGSGNNYIDDLVNEKLNQLKIPTGNQATDLAFLRRASLDLAGRLPTPEQIQSFKNAWSPNKRELLLDKLLSSESFTDYWTYRIATQLRIRSQPQDKIGAKVYHSWLRRQIADNQSWKKICIELLQSKGDTHKIGPANFYRATKDARLQSEFVTESLLGVKLRCANCHNHPFDHWTQDDYHGLAAIFSKVKQSRFVTLNPAGENVHARTGKPARPRVPGAFFIEEKSDDRIPLSKWLVNKDNPYFARSMVNRIWQALMGRGLVEPIDDLRSTNPATHPELLKRLADDFVEHDFDLKQIIKRICMSKAYQRACGQPGTPSFHFEFLADARVRPLPPEVLADSIGDVTGVFEKYGERVTGTRAIQLFDSKIPSRSLDLLGRCSREESCESDTQASSGGLSTQLHLLNGDLINQKLSAIEGNLVRLISDEKTTAEIVNFYYIRAFSRPPTKEEMDWWSQQLDAKNDIESKTTKTSQSRFEDFVWSILNSKEFTTNH